MTPRALNSRHALEACTLQLHAWKPFQIQSLPVDPPNPYTLPTKKPCRSDRSTAPPLDADGLDLFRLSLLDDPPTKLREDGGLQWLAARKRRRRGSRSVSGRSSDRSGTRRLGGCGGASAANATCSDFPLATGGTDSSGELFVNGDGSCCSDVSEVRVSRKEGREGGGGEGSAFGSYPGGLDSQGNESGYGSEPGYRGDAEFGYGDEVDEEDEDGKHLFWGGGLGDLYQSIRPTSDWYQSIRPTSDWYQSFCPTSNWYQSNMELILYLNDDHLSTGFANRCNMKQYQFLALSF